MTATMGGTTWRDLPAGVRETLAHAYDNLVRRNPLAPGLKKHILEDGLGPDRLRRVMHWIGIHEDDPSMGELDRTLSFEEKVLLQILPQGADDPAALRHATGHRWEAWTDLLAFSRQADAFVQGYGENV